MARERIKTFLSRRQFLQCGQGAIACAIVGGKWIGNCWAAEPPATAATKPLAITAGPQLFIDDYFIDHLEGLKREIRPPKRTARPIMDAKTFGTWQPYLTVLRDDQNNRFRVWYNNGPAVWHAESDDAISWRNPREVYKCSHCFGASVIDDLPRTGEGPRRFKLANWQATRIKEDQPGDDGGVWIAFSPDGLNWTSYDKNPVLPTWPEGYGKNVAYAAQDVVDVFYDPLQKCYGVALKTPAVSGEGFAQGPRAGKGIRRLVGMSTSTDFVHWEKPWRILTPDEKDSGLLEFYGMGAIHQRGGLNIGLARILHDDYACDEGGPKNGIGYSVLVTSRDGRNWQRFREPFLDRNPKPESWDHAMTWIGCALPLGEEMLFYYGGYAHGHKINPMAERQIGLARMKKDRYVALAATAESGAILTKPFIFPGGKVTLNADAAGGAIAVRMLAANEAGVAISEAEPITGDVLSQEMRWNKPIAAMQQKPIRLELRLKSAALFGIDFHSA